jgi:hypothetical protein
MRRGGSPRRRERGRRRGIGRGARASGGEHDSRRPHQGRQLDTSATALAPTVPQHSTHANLPSTRRGTLGRRAASAHPERLLRAPGRRLRRTRGTLRFSRRRDRRGARRPEPRRHAGRRARADPQRAAQRRLRRRARRDAVHVLLGGARQPRGRPRAPRPSHVRARERPAGRVGDGQRVRAQARRLRRLHHRLGQRRAQPRPRPRYREPSASR